MRPDSSCSPRLSDRRFLFWQVALALSVLVLGLTTDVERILALIWGGSGRHMVLIGLTLATLIANPICHRSFPRGPTLPLVGCVLGTALSIVLDRNLIRLQTWTAEVGAGLIVGLSALMLATFLVRQHLERAHLGVRWVAAASTILLWYANVACLILSTRTGRLSLTNLGPFNANLIAGGTLILLAMGAVLFPPAWVTRVLRRPQLQDFLTDPDPDTISDAFPEPCQLATSPPERASRRWLIVLVAGLALLPVLFLRYLPPDNRPIVPLQSLAFSPLGEAENTVIAAIDAAKSEIKIAMFAFTNRPIRESVIRAKKRGVDVQVILDRKQASSSYSVWRRGEWKTEAIPTRFSTQTRGFMHHKYAVIDGKTVLTGSFNWTGQAEGVNQENLLVLESPTLASRYLENFARIPCSSVPPLDPTGPGDRAGSGRTMIDE